MRTAFLSIGVLLLVSCSRKNKIPRDVLPQSKMQTVLWDLMRADQFLADYVLSKDSTADKTKERLKYYQQVFSIHKISREEFDRSYNYYNTKPELLRAMMDSISKPPVAQASDNTEQVVTPVAIPDSVAQSPAFPAKVDTISNTPAKPGSPGKKKRKPFLPIE